VQCMRFVGAHGSDGRIYHWRVNRWISSIFVAMDRSDDELLNGGAGCMSRCLDEVDLEIGGSTACESF
jgi:hypothetical protein